MNNMHNGRPKHHSYYTEFYPHEQSDNVHSNYEYTDVSGWQRYSGKVDKDRKGDGEGKTWYTGGVIQIGQWNDGVCTDGEEYKLQDDGTYSLFKYKDGMTGEVISTGHTNY